MSFDGTPTYEHRSGILARTYLTKYEKRAMRRKRRVDFIAKVVVGTCAVIIAVLVYG